MLETKKGPIVMNMSKTEMDIIMLSPLIFGVCMILWMADYISKQILIGDEIDVGFVVLVTIISFFILWVGWMGYTDYKAYFDYSEKGLGVKYLLQKRKVIPWNEFQQVCVCYASHMKYRIYVGKEIIDCDTMYIRVGEINICNHIR